MVVSGVGRLCGCPPVRWNGLRDAHARRPLFPGERGHCPAVQAPRDYQHDNLQATKVRVKKSTRAPSPPPTTSFHCMPLLSKGEERVQPTFSGGTSRSSQRRMVPSGPMAASPTAAARLTQEGRKMTIHTQHQIDMGRLTFVAVEPTLTSWHGEGR